jgi:hypothetical protein
LIGIHLALVGSYFSQQAFCHLLHHLFRCFSSIESVLSNPVTLSIQSHF